MKPGQSSKRARGRPGGRRGGNRQQTFDSNGPSVRIRGNAFQVHEKYLGLARDAASSGDRIGAENYYQHAEHYFRIYSADMEERNQRLAGNGQGSDGQRRPNARGHTGNGRMPAVSANGANGEDRGEIFVEADSAKPTPESEATRKRPARAAKPDAAKPDKERVEQPSEEPAEETAPPSGAETPTKSAAGD